MRDDRSPFRLWWLGAALCTICLLSNSALAWSYHSFSYGYTVSLPEDWEQVPDEVLAVRGPGLPAIRSRNGRFDVAFQPKRKSKWMDYPYILVEVVPYSSMGYQQQVDQREILEIVKANTGLDPLNPYPTEGQTAMGGGEAESDTVLDFEQTNHRFMWSSTSHLDRLGTIRTRQWGFFGKDCLVNITLYEQGRGSERLRDMARTVAGSFKYEIGREYQPAFTAGEFARMLKQLVSTPSTGVIVTGGCVGVAVIFALVSLFTSRSRPPVEQIFTQQRNGYDLYR